MGLPVTEQPAAEQDPKELLRQLAVFDEEAILDALAFWDEAASPPWRGVLDDGAQPDAGPG